jgi:hypothetical protein
MIKQTLKHNLVKGQSTKNGLTTRHLAVTSMCNAKLPARQEFRDSSGSKSQYLLEPDTSYYKTSTLKIQLFKIDLLSQILIHHIK